MKFLILSLNHYVGGSEQLSLYLYDALKKYTDWDVQHIILTLSGRPKKGAMQREFCQYYTMSPKNKKYQETIKKISEFDIVQVSDMGHYDVDHKFFKEGGIANKPPYFELFHEANELNPESEWLGIWSNSPDYIEKTAYPFCKDLAECLGNIYSIRPLIAENTGTRYLPQLIDKGRLPTLTKKTNLAVNTSRCVSFKGQIGAVRAVPFINGHVNIWGMGSTRYSWQISEEFKKLKKKDQNKILLIKDYFDNSKIGEILLSAKVMFNLTKIQDGGGGTEYTSLEALKYGAIPIIDNDWGGEFAKECCLSVDRKDPKDIAEKVNYVFKNKEWYKKKVESNYKYLRDNHSLDVVKEYIDYFNELFVPRKAKLKRIDVTEVVKRIKTKAGVKKTRMILPIDDMLRYMRKSAITTKIFNGSKIRMKYFYAFHSGKLIIDAWKTGR